MRAEKARNLISQYSTGVGAYALQNLPETDARALAGHVKVSERSGYNRNLNGYAPRESNRRSARKRNKF